MLADNSDGKRDTWYNELITFHIFKAELLMLRLGSFFRLDSLFTHHNDISAPWSDFNREFVDRLCESYSSVTNPSLSAQDVCFWGSTAGGVTVYYFGLQNFIRCRVLVLCILSDYVL